MTVLILPAGNGSQAAGQFKVYFHRLLSVLGTLVHLVVEVAEPMAGFTPKGKSPVFVLLFDYLPKGY
jgi:hypothetical protein